MGSNINFAHSDKIISYRSFVLNFKPIELAYIWNKYFLSSTIDRILANYSKASNLLISPNNKFTHSEGILSLSKLFTFLFLPII